MKTRQVRIKYDSFNNKYTAQIKALNLFWISWFYDGNGIYRGISASNINRIYEFLYKIEKTNKNLKLIRKFEE